MKFLQSSNAIKAAGCDKIRIVVFYQEAIWYATEICAIGLPVVALGRGSLKEFI
jgi:hypothetical protein